VLYVYPDIAKTVTSPASVNKTKTITLNAVKTYIAGRVDAKCSPKSVAEGEDVSCLLTVDDTPSAQPLAAGATVSLIFSPGKHKLQFDLSGANAALWSPPSLVKTITVYAGPSASPVTATFTKANHLLAKLSVADWVGDFYVDGTLATPQAPALDMFVQGNASHKIEVKNIALPGSPLIHPYYDGSRTFYAAANGTSNITVTLNKVPQSATQNISHANFKGISLTTTMYLTWWPVWAAKSIELVEENANHIFLVVNLDGVYVGDISPYRQKAFTQPDKDGTYCGDPAWTPCYSLAWKIPLGRLAEGPHYLYAENVPFAVDVNTGFEIIPAGTSYYWDEEFYVNAAP
jgi:hypothetical protein